MPQLLNPAGWEVGEWGVGVTPGPLWHFFHIEHPMRRFTKLAEFESYPFPDLTGLQRHEHLEQRSAIAPRPRPVRHRLHGMDDF